MQKSIFRIAAIAALVALVAGCNAPKLDNCPTMAAIVDASAMTIFRQGTTPDPSNVLYSVRIVEVKGNCDFKKKERSADADLKVVFQATRAPTGDAAQYTVPYFVGITEGSDRILARQAYQIPFSFAPGQASVTFTDDVSSARVQAAKGKMPYDYQVLVGLQITKEQLEYNKTKGNWGQ